MNRNRSILLVEDDANDVYFLQRAFREAEIDVPLDVVHNGDAAIEFLQRAATRARSPEAVWPCLVLLDLNLPGKSGLQVLRWIRRESDWKTILVIVLTSSTAESDMNEAYSLGANSFLVKPSDATRLGEVAHFIKGYWLGWNQLPPVALAL